MTWMWLMMTMMAGMPSRLLETSVGVGGWVLTKGLADEQIAR